MLSKQTVFFTLLTLAVSPSLVQAQQSTAVIEGAEQIKNGTEVTPGESFVNGDSLSVRFFVNFAHPHNSFRTYYVEVYWINNAHGAILDAAASGYVGGFWGPEGQFTVNATATPDPADGDTYPIIYVKDIDGNQLVTSASTSLYPWFAGD